MARPLAVALALLLIACSGGAPQTEAGPEPSSPPGFEVVQAEAQRAGDADRGYAALTGEGYVSCGVPRSVYEGLFGVASERARLPGRQGWGAELPCYVTGYTSESGVELVTGNCLSCHAGWLEGELPRELR